MTERRRCGATIEGAKRPSGVVMWRKQCKAWPVKGAQHCLQHLTWEEREARRKTDDPL